MINQLTITLNISLKSFCKCESNGNQHQTSHNVKNEYSDVMSIFGIKRILFKDGFVESQTKINAWFSEGNVSSPEHDTTNSQNTNDGLNQSIN